MEVNSRDLSSVGAVGESLRKSRCLIVPGFQPPNSRRARVVDKCQMMNLALGTYFLEGRMRISQEHVKVLEFRYV